jgi:hypothetical protein
MKDAHNVVLQNKNKNHLSFKNKQDINIPIDKIANPGMIGSDEAALDPER